MRRHRFALAALLLAAPTALRAAWIEEVDSGVPSPYGIAFTPLLTRYVVGGAYMQIDDYSGSPEGGATDLRDAVTAPDGSLWMVDVGASRIFRFHEVGYGGYYPVSGGPIAVAFGPDGNAWFTEGTGNKIARLTVDGTVTEYSIPTASSHPTGIVAGPDGALWFVEQIGNKVGRITTSGHIDEYPLKTAGASPSRIAASEAFLAITEPGVDKIAFFDLKSRTVLDEPAIPTPLAVPYGITLGADGAFWFTEYGVAKLGRVKPYENVVEYPTPTAGSSPRLIVSGPDGDLWFTEKTGKLGHVVLQTSADADGDGNVDVSDVFYLINFLFAGGPAPK